jgi:hypothetical protein
MVIKLDESTGVELDAFYGHIEVGELIEGDYGTYELGRYWNKPVLISAGGVLALANYIEKHRDIFEKHAALEAGCMDAAVRAHHDEN